MGFRQRILPIVAMLGIGPSCAWAEGLFISLRPTAEVETATVLLGDIAEVVSVDTELGNELKRLPIKRLATLTIPGRVGREDVLAALAQHKLTQRQGVAWGGETHCDVSGRKRMIDLTPGVDAAAALVMDRLGNGRGINIRVVDAGAPVLDVAGNTRVVPDTKAVRRLGRFVDVPLQVDVDGKPVASRVVRFEVGLTPGAAIEEVLAGAPGTTRVHREPQPVELDLANAGDWAVRKDQAVRVIVSVGSVRLEGKGVALADARGGETVLVRYAGNGSTLGGTVRGPGLVMVQEN